LLELTLMLEILLASIIGGFGTISGGVAGGLFIYWGLDWLQGSEVVLPLLERPIGDVATLVFFGMLLLLVYFLEEGLLPWSVRQGGRLRSRIRPGSEDAVTDGGVAVAPNRGDPPATGQVEHGDGSQTLDDPSVISDREESDD
jgi:branched-chain amino acid transport system permease protein